MSTVARTSKPRCPEDRAKPSRRSRSSAIAARTESQRAPASASGHVLDRERPIEGSPAPLEPRDSRAGARLRPRSRRPRRRSRGAISLQDPRLPVEALLSWRRSRAPRQRQSTLPPRPRPAADAGVDRGATGMGHRAASARPRPGAPDRRGSQGTRRARAHVARAAPASTPRRRQPGAPWPPRPARPASRAKTQIHRERDQARLSAVVEVAPDPLQLRRLRLDRAGAGQEIKDALLERGAPSGPGAAESGRRSSPRGTSSRRARPAAQTPMRAASTASPQVSMRKIPQSSSPGAVNRPPPARAARSSRDQPPRPSRR